MDCVFVVITLKSLNNIRLQRFLKMFSRHFRVLDFTFKLMIRVNFFMQCRVWVKFLVLILVYGFRFYHKVTLRLRFIVGTCNLFQVVR